jgi:hypothetical protein
LSFGSQITFFSVKRATWNKKIQHAFTIRNLNEEEEKLGNLNLVTGLWLKYFMLSLLVKLEYSW